MKFKTLKEIEKNHIITAINKFQVFTHAAKALGIARSTLWRKIEEHNINVDKVPTKEKCIVIKLKKHAK